MPTTDMNVENIKRAVRNLSKTQLAEFREWFDGFDAEQWDRQFEQDVKDGKLDKFVAESEADIAAGRFRKL